jgi:hypothetical protein
MSRRTPRRRSLLAIAIERRDWETASLCLLVGIALAAQSWPRAQLDDLLDTLARINDTRDER